MSNYYKQTDLFVLLNPRIGYSKLSTYGVRYGQWFNYIEESKYWKFMIKKSSKIYIK